MNGPDKHQKQVTSLERRLLPMGLLRIEEVGYAETVRPA